MQLLYSVRSLSVRLQEQEKIEKEINAQLKVELAERRLAEEKLERTLIDLERSNKELEQFAYVASHDLQEPLRKVGSFTELLERRYKDQMGPDADRYIGYIVDGAKRMSMLINDLLTFSRIGTHAEQFAKTNFNTVLHRTLDDLQYRIRESGANITSDDLPVLMADETQIGLVFQNLISNAMKFCRDAPSRVHVSARHEKGVWIFSVSDNGIGIEPDYFDRIFVMFQRLHAKGEYKGTGIGLAICKKIVERHGGRIWVESSFGKGSTFYFTIAEDLREVVET
jgi:light-regulated signal transduction histidine kinase (bacteriophytochrome)